MSNVRPQELQMQHLRRLVALVLFAPLTVLAQNGDWRWFISHGFPGEDAWEIREGFADVCLANGQMVASLYRRREPSDPAIAPKTERGTGRQLYPRYPLGERVAEIVGSPRQKGSFQVTYARWGTDEGGQYLTADYFGHRHAGGGYEGFTFFATGSLIIGLRRDVQKGGALLFGSKRGPTQQCPLPYFIPASDGK